MFLQSHVILRFAYLLRNILNQLYLFEKLNEVLIDLMNILFKQNKIHPHICGSI